MEKGLNVITLPKTIDNDVGMTDTTFGFDTALGIATDAIDRLHSTSSQPPPDYCGGDHGASSWMVGAWLGNCRRGRCDSATRDWL